MYVRLSIVVYPNWLGWAGFLSMALFRFPLWLSSGLKFWKLMGTGKNGTFDKNPDWNRWAVLEVYDSPASTPTFITAWWKLFNAKQTIYELEPIEGHGLWDGKQVFGDLPKNSDYEGKIAVLTRATIKLSGLKRFWEHVDAIAGQMASAPGFITSVGIGEVPFIKQATFSIWESKELMRSFAYKLPLHKEVIKITHQEKWYSEDMFTRFKVIEK
jgi:hypothetical protein